MTGTILTNMNAKRKQTNESLTKNITDIQIMQPVLPIPVP